MQKTVGNFYKHKKLTQKLKVLKKRKRKLSDISKIEEYNEKIAALEDKIIEDDSDDSDDSNEN